MNWIRPEVRLISTTTTMGMAFDDWITSICGDTPSVFDLRDADDNESDEFRDGQDLIEAAGRRCYKSLAPSLHSNVTKVRGNQGDFLRNIIKQGHGSVLEHVTATFAIEGCSRVFTHELVRHRPGMAYSQESMRYVSLDSLTMAETSLTRDYLTHTADTEPPFEPASAQDGLKQELCDIVRAYVERSETFLAEARDLAYRIEGFDLARKEEIPFSVRKRVTSWLRRFAPMGIATGIVVTANLRALRHLIPTRTSLGAEEEIAEIFGMVAKICVDQWPDIFFDFERKDRGDAPGIWTCKYPKV